MIANSNTIRRKIITTKGIAYVLNRSDIVDPVKIPTPYKVVVKGSIEQFWYQK